MNYQSIKIAALAGIAAITVTGCVTDPETGKKTISNAAIGGIIGVGGGSPMDASKAIALMIKKADKDISYLYSPDGDSSTIPIVAVPTTCGTGSEVTAVSVLTMPEKKKKKDKS